MREREKGPFLILPFLCSFVSTRLHIHSIEQCTTSFFTSLYKKERLLRKASVLLYPFLSLCLSASRYPRIGACVQCGDALLLHRFVITVSMASIESQGVVYSATFDIPYVIGSVAVPLTATSLFTASREPDAVRANDNDSTSAQSTTAHAVDDDSRAGHAGPALSSSSSHHHRGVRSGNLNSVRRCTHHRYCYLRDGGALPQDAFYRWLQHQQRDLTDTETGGDRTAAPRSPSLFYASLDAVVFVLPKSFPHPRRVLRRPPYLIEDDTWAEHMIEVQLHFLPHLRIPPMTVVHQALLERRSLPPLRHPPSSTVAADEGMEGEVREVWVPQLRASTFGKPKLPPVAAHVVIPNPHYAMSTAIEGDDTTPTTAPPAHSTGIAANTTVVVAEKVDTLRVYHPSVTVLQHVRRVLALSSSPVLRELHDAYTQLHLPLLNDDGDSVDRSLETPFAFPWSLPYEAVVATYAAQRATTAVAVLQAVLGELKRERAAMEATCRRSMDEVAALATWVIPDQLAEVHQRCLKLYRKE